MPSWLVCQVHASRPLPSICRAVNDSSKDAIAARISAARRYKTDGGVTQKTSIAETLKKQPVQPVQPPPMSSGGGDPRDSYAASTAVSWQQSFSSLPPSPSSHAPSSPPSEQASVPFLERTSDPSLPPSEVAQMVLNAPQTPGSGSAIEPANFLAAVLSSSEAQMDPSMRMVRLSNLGKSLWASLCRSIMDPIASPGIPSLE